MSREPTTTSFTSFGSDFDPEAEAIASTKEMDNSPKLPDMKGSARNQYRHFEAEEPDYAIDTSALERALPDFSPVGTSDEDDEHEHEDDDISVEVGRGVLPKPTRRLDDSRNSFMSFENSVRSSSPAIRLDYPTSSHTPQKSAMRSTPRRAVSENLRKDAQLRSASQAHKENVDPQTARQNRKDQRRTLSDMHARVRDSYDGSFLGDERPPAVAMNARSTRFGSHQIADAVERASQEAYAKEMRRSKSNNSRNISATMNGDTMTHQSFLLPDLPNLSELVSGVYDDGTPVYSRQSKTRTARFVSPSHDPADVSMTREHMPLDAVPIPEDEKALFVSLRLLQDKVAELEFAKSEAERKIDEMRQENVALKADRPRQKDRHGRSRTYEADDDHRKDSQRAASQIQKLEAANLALQNRSDIAERKAQLNENALKRLSRERDMAVSQLGVAYLESQDFKAENETLRQENAEMKAQLARLASFPQRNRDDTLQSEEISGTEDVDEDSRVHTQRSADMSRSTRDVTSKSTRSRSKATRQDDSRAKISSQIEKEISRLERQRAEDALFSIDIPRTSRSKSEKLDKKPHSKSTNAKKQSSTGKHRVKRVIVEEVDVTEPTTEDGTGRTGKSSGSDGDVTLLSFMDEREIAQLRKTLEEERLARKHREPYPTKDITFEEIVHSTRQSMSKPTAPRKSSLKEAKAVPPRPASAAGEASKTSFAEGDNHLSVPIDRPRRHSDHSIPPISQRKRQRNTDDMTSAFILPDITLHHAALAAQDPTLLPEATQRALDSFAQHKGKNCSVCKGVMPGGICTHSQDAVKVPKPVPVSERMPEPSVYNEEPTMRPSQPPAVALAAVLKALEDELSHLKIQLATYQGAYNKLDASVSKRQRKSVAEKIEKLFKDIDMKSDQIYALYDVLEGQKDSGHEMTEQEMEMTLQSIGIDIPAERTADLTATTDKSSRKNDNADYEVEDDDDDLPWEGIESTMDMTGKSASNRRN